MGPDYLTNGSGLISCEDALTQSSTKVIINPSHDLKVDYTSLYNGNTGQCWDSNATPCTTKHPNQCGNECEIPNSGTCQEIADELLLSLTRFEELNSNLDCSDSKNIPAGTTVCMGGPCGD